MINKYPGLQIVGEASNGEQLVKLSATLRPDLIITDIKMPVMDGIAATKEILAGQPEARIVAFTMFDEEALIVDMLEAGALGYLLKSSSKDEIIEAIETVMRYQPYYCRQTTRRLAHLIAASKFDLKSGIQKPKFTEKEVMVIRMICEGASNKEMAARSGMSIRTIEGYRERIQEKMEIRNTAGIVVFAIRWGLYRI